jgi:hypothetical protein
VKHDEMRRACSTNRKKRGNAYMMLVGKPEGKRSLGRTKRRSLDNVKMDFREIGCDGMNGIDLAQGRDQSRARVNININNFCLYFYLNCCVDRHKYTVLNDTQHDATHKELKNL